MKISRSALAVSLLALVTSAPAFAQDQPQRHLVYNFTFGVQNDEHDTNASIRQVNSPTASGGYQNVYGTGDTKYDSTATDIGTITVDILGVQPDGGLHVRVAEVGRYYRRSAPMDCVVYPTTKVACTGRPYPEEADVISTLSPGFFNPAVLDAKNHWRVADVIPGLTLDFTASAPSGSVVSIAEDKNQKMSGGLGGTDHGSATFTYDTVRRIPTALKTYDTQRPAQGQPGQYANIILNITATLATDSGTTAKN
ncbi:MAG: hypothetical protein WBD74_11920 [Candidatus Aquilonibacter sp.]